MIEIDLSGTVREREGAFDRVINRQDRHRLALLLRRLREEAGLQQGELAARLKVPQAVLSKIESGYREVAVLELRAISTALGLPLDEIVSRIEAELSGDVLSPESITDGSTKHHESDT